MYHLGDEVITDVMNEHYQTLQNRLETDWKTFVFENQENPDAATVHLLKEVKPMLQDKQLAIHVYQTLIALNETYEQDNFTMMTYLKEQLNHYQS